ncbi:TetR/AcrR family transcriptional regulator [Lentilactobacillus sp. Marseille-Q4993]|uniref:TetR/AcrR family transcriptional regulator n=1 Tax=Lentilactobacillus sp. Marseille-Q4993 TaxID=3039492 RepID=UPI0024BC1210|nr:TetR/AcrR family transcriptional regulator [Lentilactobacillus sp. Marseille-Q4993]
MSESNPEKLKTKILQSAQPLFIENGYKKVTYKEIANEVGISKSLLQYYFPKKAEILEQLMIINFDHWLKSIPIKDSYTKLTTFMMLFFDFISRDDKIHEFMNEIIDNNELFNVFMGFFDKWLTEKELVKEEAKQIKASFLFATSGGLQLYRFRKNYQLQINQIVKTIIQTLLNLLHKSQQFIDDTLESADEYYNQLKNKGWQLVTISD